MLGLRTTARQLALKQSRSAKLHIRSSGFGASRWLSTEGEKKEEKTEEKKNEEQADSKAEEASPEVAALNETVKKLEGEVAEMKDKMLRAYAEMENVRQRSKREVESSQTYANQKFAKSLLEVADNLTRGLESVPKDALEGENAHPQLTSLFEGIKMTETQLLKVFEANGITRFGQVGDKFDPQLHEAMYQFEHPEHEPGTIGFLMQSGYKFKDRVLRPAQVGTVKAKQA